LRAELVAGELRRADTRRRPRGPSSIRVALLSFIVPGLGHFAQGRMTRGVLLVIPTLAAFAAIAGLLLRGSSAVLAALLRPEVMLAIVALDLVILVTRVAAILDSWVLAERRAVTGIPFRPLSLTLVVVLIAGSLLAQGTLAAVGYQAYTTLGVVFTEDAGANWTIPTLATPTPYVPAGGVLIPGPTRNPEPDSTPVPGWAADGRLNLLLIGSDAGPGRFSLRTDTMEVLSVDIKTAHAVLFGIPRNIVNVPLADEDTTRFANNRFPDLLNGLYVYAMQHPEQFPGGDARGFRAVSGAIQELIDQPLDGAVVVSLNGFVRLIDAIGGLWIDVPQRVYDDRYPLEDGSGYVTINIAPGCHHFKGHLALAYARSRHQDDDYHRMRRQQSVLVALLHQVDPIDLIPQVSDLLSIAKDGLWMTVKREDIRGLAQLAAKVEPSSVRSVQFSPPTYPEYLTTSAIKKIRSVAANVFTQWSTTPKSTASPTPTPEACGPSA
jgi:LCP family protein required for cell wall assembly